MSARILLVDDDPAFLSRAAEFLTAHGFVVDGASSSREAARAAAKNKPDVAVVDFHMPGGNGLQCAASLRRHSPHTRFLIVTVHDDLAYVISALRAGFSGYVVKSRVVEDLVPAIHTALDGSIYLACGNARL
jgi:DNA-binding NarL/FixJ family response regulator